MKIAQTTPAGDGVGHGVTGGGLPRALEFAALFLGLPLMLALMFPPGWMLPMLLGATALGAALLSLTRGFAWRELLDGWRRIDWRHVALVGGITAGIAGVLVWWLAPDRALILPRTMPGLWLMIMLLYPLLSALPQELLFRPLFFRRYGALFPGRWAGMLANALIFGLAHLMFWNWVAVALSAAGGLIFAHAYVVRGSFPLAVMLHAVCGAIIFTSGLGEYFYHGVVSGRMSGN